MGSLRMILPSYFRGVQSYHKTNESIVLLIHTDTNVTLLLFNRILWRYIEGGRKPNYCITGKFSLSWALSGGGVIWGV
jgi:hypothetical protein